MTGLEMIQNAGFDLRTLTSRYAESCWGQGWKPGMEKKLADPNNPFCGGPGDLIRHGTMSLMGSDGNMIEITPLTRIKLKQLSENAIAAMSIACSKDLSHVDREKHSNSDVIHPEFVATFAENVANSAKHFLNNGVAAAATVETVLCSVIGPDASVEEAIACIEGLISDDPSFNQKRQLLNIATRSAWLGRACQDGSWESSGDFVFKSDLLSEQAALDCYVVVPVLKYLLEDLKNGFSR